MEPSVGRSDLLQSDHDYPRPDLSAPESTTSSPLNLADVSPKVYRTLEAWQTRIILLESGTYGDPLVIQLLPVDIIYADGVVITADRVRISYEAVSYSWGHDTLTKKIMCNGEAFPVNPNVYIALQRLRHSKLPRCLWLDAISINQLDSEEKGSQIAQMFSIFKKASGVVVWLGAEDERERLALYHLQQGQTLVGLEGPLGSDFLPQLSDLCEGLVSLASRAFFGRIWVQQEIFAARQVTVQIGASILSWNAVQSIPNQLEKANEILRSHGQNDEWFLSYDWRNLRQAEQDHLTAVEAVDTHRSSSFLNQMNVQADRTWSRVDVGRILLQGASLSATDHRDFVYGVLGKSNANLRTSGPQFEIAASEGPQVALRIDYTRSVSQVFQDATRYLICRDRRLDVLMVAWCLRPKDDLDIPSWTPDWRIGHRPRWLNDVRIRDQLYLSDYFTQPDNTFNEDKLIPGRHIYLGKIVPTEDDPITTTNILRVRGATCGTIHCDDTSVIFRPKAELEVDLARVGTSYITPPDLPGFKELTDSTLAPRRVLLIRTIGGQRDRKFVPANSRSGDVVVLLQGCGYPFVLRHIQEKKYTLVGPVLTGHRPWLLDGLDGGEYLRKVASESALESFELL